MNTTFSFNRTWLLIKADFVENKKSLTIYSLIMITLVLFYFYFRQNATEISVSDISLPFFLGSFATYLLVLGFHARKINNPNNNYLVVPANNLEKFCAFLLEIIIMQLICLILFYISLLLSGCIWHKNLQSCKFYENKNDEMVFFPHRLIYTKVLILFCKTITIMNLWQFLLFMIGSLTFKKHATLKSCIIIIAATIFIVVKFERYFIYIFQDAQCLNGFVVQNSYHGITAFIHNNQPWIFGFMAIALLYIAYLKFKEKEV